MIYHKDYAGLFALWNERRIDYLVVGGYAVAFHGAPRFTGDIDLLVRPDEPSVRGVLDTLKEFGFPAEGVSPDYLISAGKILEIGRIPVQIHLMTSISGLVWTEAWDSRVRGRYGDVPVFYLGREALVRSSDR